MFSKDSEVHRLSLVFVPQLDELTVTPPQRVRLANAESGADAHEHEPIQLLPLLHRPGIQPWFRDPRLRQLSNLDPLLMIKEGTRVRHNFPGLSSERREFRKSIEHLFNEFGVAED